MASEHHPVECDTMMHSDEDQIWDWWEFSWDQIARQSAKQDMKQLRELLGDCSVKLYRTDP